MKPPPQNHLAWKVSITILHVVALASAAFRLIHRVRTRRMWWDDYIIVIPFALDVVYISIMWAKFGNKDISWYLITEGFAFSDWFSAFLYFTIIWLSKTSLILSVARVFAPGHRFRLWIFIISGNFLAIYLACILLTTFGCRSTPTAWYKLDYTQCLQTKSGASVGTIITVLLDFASDMVLIALPIYMLLGLRMHPNMKTPIVLIFSASIMTLIAAVLYCAVWYAVFREGPDSRLIFTMIGHLQTLLSLFVANLLVVATVIIRRIKGDSLLSSFSEAEPSESEQYGRDISLRVTNTNDPATSPNSPPSTYYSTLTLTSIYESTNGTNNEQSRTYSKPPSAPPSSRFRIPGFRTMSSNEGASTS